MNQDKETNMYLCQGGCNGYCCLSCFKDAVKCPYNVVKCKKCVNKPKRNENAIKSKENKAKKFREFEDEVERLFKTVKK